MVAPAAGRHAFERRVKPEDVGALLPHASNEYVREHERRAVPVRASRHDRDLGRGLGGARAADPDAGRGRRLEQNAS